MSSDFESVFKNWLTHREEDEEGNFDEEDGERVEDLLSGSQQDGGEGKMHLDREAWEEEDMNEMPILQKMVDLPSKQIPEHGSELGPSPPPPPLQKSVGGDLRKGCERITSRKSRSCRKARSKAFSCIQESSHVHTKSSQLQEGDESFVKNVCSKQHLKMGKSLPVINRRKFVSRATAKEMDSSLSPVHLTLDQETINSDNSLPASPSCIGDVLLHPNFRDEHMMQTSRRDSSSILSRELRKSCVLSPERDLVEPDSTSEILDVPNVRKSPKSRSKEELSRVNLSVAHAKTKHGLGHSGEVTVRITDEGVGECDSTSMCLASPSAISPASQGEIEERMCPVMADNEDGGHHLTEWGTGHCICQCRSLTSPPDLPFLPSKKSRSSHSSKNSLTSRHLVRKNRLLSCDSLPHLERMPICTNQNESLDLEGTGNQICESPPMLSLPELELQGEGDLICSPKLDPEIGQGSFMIKSEPAETPPLLVKYEVEDKLHNQSKGLLEDFSYDESPPVLILPMKVYRKGTKGDSRRRHSSRRKRSSSARKKEAMSPPCLTKYEAKPSESGIVLKLRAKRTLSNPRSPQPDLRSDMPQLLVEQKTLSTDQIHPSKEPESVSESAVDEKKPPKQEPKQEFLLEPKPVARRRHTVDSPEFPVGLRKRKRDSEPEQGGGESRLHDPSKHQQDGLKEREDFGSRGKRQKAGLGGACSCCRNPSPKHKRRRRNTVHLGDPFFDLSPVQRDFVLFSVKLSRLQTRTHSLVCTLFPRLAPDLQNIAPESQKFLEAIDDIIGSLQRSELEENNKDSADLSCLIETLSLADRNEEGEIPVYLPQVVVCQSPQHSLEEFQDKVCIMLQLLLPDITVSLSDNLFHTSEELELMLEKIIAANMLKPSKKE